MIADLFPDLLKFLFEAVTSPISPPTDELLAVTLEPEFPMREKFGWNDRRIMRPVFEQEPIPLKVNLEVLFLVGRSTRSQDHVVGPGDRIDAVDLDKTQLIKDGRQVFTLTAALERGSQSVFVEKKPACLDIRHPW